MFDTFDDLVPAVPPDEGSGQGRQPGGHHSRSKRPRFRGDGLGHELLVVGGWGRGQGAILVLWAWGLGLGAWGLRKTKEWRGVCIVVTGCCSAWLSQLFGLQARTIESSVAFGSLRGTRHPCRAIFVKSWHPCLRLERPRSATLRRRRTG
jgi:hypothetical protein